MRLPRGRASLHSISNINHCPQQLRDGLDQIGVDLIILLLLLCQECILWLISICSATHRSHQASGEETHNVEVGGWFRQVVDQIKCPCTLITFCWSGRNGLGYYATICYSEQNTSLRPTATWVLLTLHKCRTGAGNREQGYKL